jgi:3-dehydroquinate synthase
LLALKPDRKTTLIALGGGVVGDLVGFAASVLLRGVPFIQIPTSLLAQVDSSVGGKTAINSKGGKNLIGSFYQPQLVLADTGTLDTLPLRELRAGYAEIIKYGLIMDESFYRWCLAHGAQMLAGDKTMRQDAVVRSCGFKAAVVKADEREADMRALLNFGHTFAHALEAETGYGEKLNHGEAVAIGMVMACRLSAELGLIGNDVEAELAAHLRALGMAAELKDIDHPWNAAAIASHFSEDKKAENGKLTFIVLDAIGKARVAKDVDAALAQQVVASYLS